MLSPAKLNLGLLIPFGYPTGFHHIISLLVPIDYGDEIDFKLTARDFELSWENNVPEPFKEGMQTALDKTTNNLIHHAFQMLKTLPDRLGSSDKWNLKPDWGLKATLNKRVPSPAGLGGGSSNAAATIEFVIKQAGLDTGHPVVREQALALGSDIPFFLEERPSLVSGVGEIKKHLSVPALTGIIGMPPFGFHTGKMYGEIRRQGIARSIFKNSLQSDKEGQNILKEAEVAFDSLVERLWAEAQNKEGSKESQLLIEKPAGWYLKNDFLQVVDAAYPDEAPQLHKGMHLLGSKMKAVTKTPIISMSGSGAAFFAFVVSQTAHRALPSIVAELEAEMPGFSWQPFSTREHK